MVRLKLLPNSAKEKVFLKQILADFDVRLSSLSARKLRLANYFRHRLEEEKIKELQAEILEDIK
jgi:hypothetical protein